MIVDSGDERAGSAAYNHIPRELAIGGREISPTAPCFIIAEAGTSHAGDLSRAKALVDAASEAGADCVKFQTLFADEILHPRSGWIELPGGKTSLFETFRTLERDETFFAEIKGHAERLGLVFLSTPFGTRSASLLQRIGVGALKIASPEINHLSLLDVCRQIGVPCIVSTGVSTISDIEQAIARLQVPLALLHCVTAYPAPPSHYNLRIIGTLRAVFGLPTGVSDHSHDPILVPFAARLTGAELIEKHIRLKESAGGLDDAIALDPAQFRSMVAAVRSVDADRELAKSELIDTHGRETVERCLGDGVKRLAESERDFYLTTNRSLLATRDIAEGERFTHENVALLRSETNLRPGLRPSWLDFLLTRVAACRIDSGAGITTTDIGAQAPSLK